MSLTAPYLLFGFDVDPANPNCSAIIADVEKDFPSSVSAVAPTSLGVANVFAVEVPPSQMNARFQKLSAYLRGKNVTHTGAIRWFVQLCHTNELSIG
ncbi:MAG: hypothetical protein M3081_00155 [Gemmatimonadota bacterium]|nr:hypothetical protein [Gemmatimonadota bacterium]